jgi:hypothetical protein
MWRRSLKLGIEKRSKYNKTQRSTNFGKLKEILHHPNDFLYYGVSISNDRMSSLSLADIFSELFAIKSKILKSKILK